VSKYLSKAYSLNINYIIRKLTGIRAQQAVGWNDESYICLNNREDSVPYRSYITV